MLEATQPSIRVNNNNNYCNDGREACKLVFSMTLNRNGNAVRGLLSLWMGLPVEFLLAPDYRIMQDNRTSTMFYEGTNQTDDKIIGKLVANRYMFQQNNGRESK